MDSIFERALLLFLPFFFLSCLARDYSSLEVTHLPGFDGKLPSRHYAGYITVNEEYNRTLYYYFVTSEGSPESDPVVLWLNGGPGCSSFDGWVYEHGPFHFLPGDSETGLPKLEINPFSWSKVANMLYVDSPAGVGMSYTNDYNCSDLKTAKDLHAFLLKWFAEWDIFVNNDFFVSGESYAGIYVPTLSREIVNGIESDMEPIVNFKGYYIGNGCTDDEYDGNAYIPFIMGHGLISNELTKEILSVCNGNYWNATGECLKLVDKAYYEVDNLNVYDILEPCYHGISNKNGKKEKKERRKNKDMSLLIKLNTFKDEYKRRVLLSSMNAEGMKEEEGEEDVIRKGLSSFREMGFSNPRQLPVRKRFVGRSWPLRYTSRKGKMKLWSENELASSVPCIDDTVGTVWLNDPEVRKAIHAKPIGQIQTWTLCTDAIDYVADAGSMIPIHKSLLEKGYRALIYSGDHDLCVPYTGSEAWVESLGYDVVRKWHPWYVDSQVAGYAETYVHNLTFITVLGSGHTVPEYKPVQSLWFHQRFLKGLPV